MLPCGCFVHVVFAVYYVLLSDNWFLVWLCNKLEDYTVVVTD